MLHVWYGDTFKIFRLNILWLNSNVKVSALHIRVAISCQFVAAWYAVFRNMSVCDLSIYEFLLIFSRVVFPFSMDLLPSVLWGGGWDILPWGGTHAIRSSSGPTGSLSLDIARVQVQTCLWGGTIRIHFFPTIKQSSLKPKIWHKEGQVRVRSKVADYSDGVQQLRTRAIPSGSLNLLFDMLLNYLQFYLSMFFIFILSFMDPPHVQITDCTCIYILVLRLI